MGKTHMRKYCVRHIVYSRDSRNYNRQAPPIIRIHEWQLTHKRSYYNELIIIRRTLKKTPIGYFK